MSESKELANRKLGEDVVGLVGGKENILSISHCMTRLRFKLRDDAKADTKAIESHKGVIQVINANGQYQVVVGINVIEDFTMPRLPLLVSRGWARLILMVSPSRKETLLVPLSILFQA